ncbi:MAG TPA: molybdopterin-dependent oxidoreductase [Actinomycetes bacterium]|nr:molybdopterin-dependent oxidoreductase [Actinomycetes bacterium]
MGRSIRLVVVALVTALAVATCGVDDGSLAVGEKIAAPKGDVVLTVTGDIGAANKGSRLELDLASLEQMRRVRLEAAEPFLKRRVMFEGVLLSDLLAMAGVPDSASKISVTALDDYKVEFKLADVRSSQMLLATRADGKHMPVDRSGPIRIVFPDGSSLGRNPDLWIWSVSSMKVA